MFTYFSESFINFFLNLVICDKKADIECNKKGAEALEGKTDQQLYDLTQANLKKGKDMVLKRAAIADASGLPCYKQFYDKYSKGMEDILTDSGEKERLDKAKTPEERSDAIKTLAGITQGIMCDEEWRAVHFNETIKSAECSDFEQKTINFLALDNLDFKPKLALLEGGLLLGKFGLKIKNPVVSGVVGDVIIKTK